MRAAVAAPRRHGQGPVRAVHGDGPSDLDFNGFRNGQGILKFDAKVSNRAVHLCVAEEELNSSKVSGLFVDLSNLGSPHRMCPIGACFKANRGYPISDDPGVLTG